MIRKEWILPYLKPTIIKVAPTDKIVVISTCKTVGEARRLPRGLVEAPSPRAWTSRRDPQYLTMGITRYSETGGPSAVFVRSVIPGSADHCIQVNADYGEQCRFGKQNENSAFISLESSLPAGTRHSALRRKVLRLAQSEDGGSV
jgi:hypothetical protein